MRPNINALVQIFSQQFDQLKTIVEIGSFQVPGQEHIADLRSFFPKQKYIGCDMRQGKGVDRIENIEKLSFKNNSIDCILSLETFEHVYNCHKAVEELYRVLQANGMVLVTTLMSFPIHDHPYDYWRFTPEVLNQLFKKFDQRIIGWQGRFDQPHTVWVLAVKKPQRDYKKDFEKIAKKHQQQVEILNKKTLRQNLHQLKHEPKKWLQRQIDGKDQFGYKVYTTNSLSS